MQHFHSKGYFWLIMVMCMFNHYQCYTLSPAEMAILEFFNTFSDIRNDLSRYILEGVALPVLAPILLRSGALYKEVPLSHIENQIKTAGVGTILHGISLLPVTLPVSALHMASAPIAVTYRRRFGRGILEREIEDIIRQVKALAAYTDKKEYDLNWINVIPQNTLLHTSNGYDIKSVRKPLTKSQLSKQKLKPVPVPVTVPKQLKISIKNSNF